MCCKTPRQNKLAHDLCFVYGTCFVFVINFKLILSALEVSWNGN